MDLSATTRAARRYVASGTCRGVAAAVADRFGVLGDVRAGDLFDVHPLWTCASKSLLTVGMARLASLGELSFNDRIARYLPILDTGAWSPIRICDVLSHSIHLHDDLGVWSVFCDDTEVMKRLRNATPNKQPGGVYLRWTNFFLIGQIMTRVTSQRWNEYIGNQIMAPLGLQETRLDFPSANLAELERSTRSWTEARPLGAHMPGPGTRVRADRYWAGMSASGPAPELATVLAVLLPGVNRLGISSSTIASMTAVHNSNTAGIEGNPLHWGLGVMVDQRIGLPRLSRKTFGYLGHNGSVAALGDPELGLSIAVALVGLPKKGLPLALRRSALIQAVLSDTLLAADARTGR